MLVLFAVPVIVILLLRNSTAKAIITSLVLPPVTYVALYFDEGRLLVTSAFALSLAILLYMAKVPELKRGR